MIASGRVIGSLIVGEIGACRSFSPEEVTLVEVMANSAASAVANALLAEEIEFSRACWQHTFDATSDMILVVDDQGKVLRANASLALHYGVTAQELLGEECERLISRTDLKVLSRVTKSGQPVTVKDSAVYGEPCEVTAFPFAEAPGEAGAVVIRAKAMSEQSRKAA
jgi:two-component system, NtrC family, sensor kinase